MRNKLKQIVIFLISTTLKLFWIIPVKKNRVLFLSFNGKQFSDSPMYIYKEMLQYGNKYELIWAFSNPDSIVNKKKVYYVRKESFKYFYYFCTSRFIIVNDTSNIYMPVRKSQVYINTWHGGGWFKKVGLSCDNYSDYTEFEFKMKNKQTTYFTASSEYFVETVLHRSFAYDGKILRTGMPRNQIFYQENKNEIREFVRRKFIEEPDTLVVLYAPTHRSYKDEIPPLDVKLISESLNKRFGKNVKVLFRAHHLIGSFDIDSSLIENVTNYPDIQELLLACDIVLSDYSSCMWEAAIQYKPIIVYAPDAQKYIDSQGFFLDMDKWPFIVGKTNKEVSEKILSFDESRYSREIRKLVADTTPYENANSVQSIVDIIINK